MRIFFGLIICLSLSTTVACGSSGKCEFKFQCDGSQCIGQGSGCDSTGEATDANSCEAYATSKSEESSAELISSTWTEGEDC